MTGVGVAIGDEMLVSKNDCSHVVDFAFAELNNSVMLQEGLRSLRMHLGRLSLKAEPGTYNLCWCPKSAGCNLNSFRAPAGSLQVHCPPGQDMTGLLFSLLHVCGQNTPPATGTYFMRRSVRCAECQQGYYCTGGYMDDATRLPCSVGRTTQAKGATLSNQCVCDLGHLSNYSMLRKCSFTFCKLHF